MLGSDNQHLLSLVLFVNDSVYSSFQQECSVGYHHQFAETVYQCCRTLKAAAASKQIKKVDFNAVDEMDESELAEQDSDDRDANTILPSLVIVGVPGLPRNAPVEIEAIGCRRHHICEEKWQSFHGSWPGALNNASTSAVPTARNIHTWPVWKSVTDSLESQELPPSASTLSIHVSAKWYPETVFSGAITIVLIQTSSDRQSGDQNSSTKLHAIVESAVQTMQQVLQTAKIRWQQVKIAKLYYSTTLLRVHCYELQSVFAQCMPAEAKNVSVVIVPCVAVEKNALLVIHLTALDLQQVETEAWVNMRD